MTSFKPMFDRPEALAVADAYGSGGDEPALRAGQAIASGDFSRVGMELGKTGVGTLCFGRCCTITECTDYNHLISKR
jgi:hypothetical protein